MSHSRLQYIRVVSLWSIVAVGKNRINVFGVWYLAFGTISVDRTLNTYIMRQVLGPPRFWDPLEPPRKLDIPSRLLANGSKDVRRRRLSRPKPAAPSGRLPRTLFTGTVVSPNDLGTSTRISLSPDGTLARFLRPRILASQPKSRSKLGSRTGAAERTPFQSHVGRYRGRYLSPPGAARRRSADRDTPSAAPRSSRKRRRYLPAPPRHRSLRSLPLATSLPPPRRHGHRRRALPHRDAPAARRRRRRRRAERHGNGGMARPSEGAGETVFPRRRR